MALFLATNHNVSVWPAVQSQSVLFRVVWECEFGLDIEMCEVKWH